MVSCIRLGRIAFGEIFPQGVGGKRDLIQVAFLFLRHNREHHILRQLPLLAEFLHALSLGEGRGCLLIVHGLYQLRLFLRREKRQLIRWIEGNFLFVYHIQQRRDQLGQADVTENLIFALTDLLGKQFAGLLTGRLVPNLGTS